TPGVVDDEATLRVLAAEHPRVARLVLERVGSEDGLGPAGQNGGDSPGPGDGVTPPGRGHGTSQVAFRTSVDQLPDAKRLTVASPVPGFQATLTATLATPGARFAEQERL